MSLGTTFSPQNNSRNTEIVLILNILFLSPVSTIVSTILIQNLVYLI